MTLPAITMPDSLPGWLCMPHDVTYGTPYADVPMSTGAARRRRVASGAAHLLDAALSLSAAQMADFHAWFEDDLQAGALPFAARVMSPAYVLQWWHARFVTPPQQVPDAAVGGVRWLVTAQLRLQGVASDEAPA
jgi:hypothetical protein